MTKKFEKAKAETIQKCNRVLEAVRLARVEEGGGCGFCKVSVFCDDCPVDKLCGGKLHNEIRETLDELEQKVIKGISLLEKVEEKKKGR